MTTPTHPADADQPDQTGQTAFICVTCGTQFPPGSEPPPACPICEQN